MSNENGLIDLRSDTVTQPTPAMRAAMAHAEVGDDVFGDDPTVNRLEELAAVMTGHEAGLFVASGTMANLVALLTHAQRGQEVILGTKSHIYLNEVGGLASLAGLLACPIPNDVDGTLPLDAIAASIRSEDVHHARTGIICLENTQNICGGAPLPAGYVKQVALLAHRHGLKLHIDGARLFNAAVALNLSAAELATPADSVMFCLSKALCAPVGSVLCGSRSFITEARRYRKQVGGGMRQAGVIAAAGIVALESMVERLEDDHANARRLAECLRGVPGLELDERPPATNMVYFNLSQSARPTPVELVDRARAIGIVVDYDGTRRFRLVTHYWVNSVDIDKVASALRAIFQRND